MMRLLGHVLSRFPDALLAERPVPLLCLGVEPSTGAQTSKDSLPL